MYVRCNRGPPATTTGGGPRDLAAVPRSDRTGRARGARFFEENSASMPRVNPEHSFEASARHLFRHINQVEALRINPLLRSYFVIEVGERASILEEIHADILALTRAICAELDAQGLRLQALRRREIVAALCADETSEETAARLQISRSHYYRERYAICSRVAAALKQGAATHAVRCVVRDDPLRLLFSRAESLRDSGSSSQAVRVLEEAYSSVAEGFAKSAVGLALAEELVFLGGRDRASELLSRSRALRAQGTDNAASEWLSDSSALNEARLQSQLSRDAAAGSALETLAKRRIAEGRSDDVTFDAVFLSGESHRNSGRYDDARKMLRHLRAMEQRYAHALAKRQIAILLLAAYCAESSTDEFGLAEQSLRDALDLSVSSGTVVGALLATSGLIHHAAASGNDEAVYAMAHDALRMAKGVDFSGFLGYVVAEIVDAVLQTDYWRAAAPLLFDAEKLTAPGTLRHALLKRAQGNFWMRIGRRDEARAAALEAYAIAKKLGNLRLEGLTLKDRASMLPGKDANRQQADLMREAVALIERCGSASDLAATYDAAARVLRDHRSLRLARQARAAGGPFAEAPRREPAKPCRRTKPIEPLRLPS